jgi:hypothetical protein
MNICFYSSFIFLLNTIYAYSINQLVYATLFLNLTTTSLYYHSTYTPIANILDKTAIVSVVTYGGYIFINKAITLAISPIYTTLMSISIISTFLFINYLYLYGKKANCYCFSNNPNIANTYHSILHFISSLGHLLIMIL